MEWQTMVGRYGMAGYATKEGYQNWLPLVVAGGRPHWEYSSIGTFWYCNTNSWSNIPVD
jgi:hypothetical protein